MDRAPAILVKELRQAVRSRVVISILFFLLGLLLIVAAFGLSTVNSVQGYSGRGLSYHSATGQRYFSSLFTLFIIPVFLFIPIYVAGNVVSERNNGMLELISATTLSEHQIILGKVSSGLVLGLFYLSIAVPFLLLSIFMRGVDLFGVLACILMTFFMLVSAIYWVLFWAVMRVPSYIKWFFYVLALGGLLMIIGLATFLCLSLLDLGIGVFTSLPWVLFFLTFWVIGVLFGHAISIDQIRTIRWESQYVLDTQIPANESWFMGEKSD